MKSAERWAVEWDDDLPSHYIRAIQRDAMQAMRDAAVAECRKAIASRPFVDGSFMACTLGDRIANIDIDKLMEAK